MANQVTMTQYNAYKNETFTLVLFRFGRRAMTYSRISVITVHETIMQLQEPTTTFLIVKSEDVPKGELFLERDIAYYEKYFKGEHIRGE